VTRFELHIDDSEYPALLRESPDPPTVLRGLGDPSLLAPGLAVIGARKATPYGLRSTRMLAGWVARHGVPVVSGAAMGCDQEAHRAALAEEGVTVAVLGCGADIDYPRRARRLLEQIRTSGVVVSERPWGAEARRWAFARRNRIIAGLCHAVLVTEASLPSGTFSTAEHALEASREVYAVPGSIFSPEARGPSRLIRQGALPITDVSELASALGGALEAAPPLDETGSDRLLAAVLADPSRPDDLARELEMDIVEVARQLGRHECAGRIAKYYDGRYGPA
jgi:DNA processing protein